MRWGLGCGAVGGALGKWAGGGGLLVFGRVVGGSGRSGFFGALKAGLLAKIFALCRIIARAARNEAPTISIYPGLEGLGFRL